ncbi:MAG: uracil phosphoribosyltransferase [Bacilli bacterium]|nr:uracil phosphoribosyltransferase [Bacilli bacterium]
MSKNVIEIKHPLIEHKLSILRDKKTSTKEFRELIKEISMILCYEALKDAKLDNVTIETPIAKMKTHRMNEDQYAFIPILRAGLGMLDGVISMVPTAKVGHIGMYRDEKTFEPVNYFFKVPEGIEKREVILLDPMLATGGSAEDAIELLKEKGVGKIKFLSIISAPEGLKRVSKKYPDVTFYTSCIDEKLNKNKYIVPGLGDAGDRIYGTK